MDRIGSEFVSRAAESQAANAQLLSLFREILPKMGGNWHRHSLVSLRVESLARVLHYSELYKQLISVPGVICEFGVQWGATLVELTNLRSIHEPFNHSRTIIGFDTFDGFTPPAPEDGPHATAGDYRSMDGYADVLARLLALHEAAAPLPHIRKHELVRGDASVTFPAWLERNPHAAIAMAIFDMDLYAPTRDVLLHIRPRLVKGSILVFDEFNCEVLPGETVAVREVLGTESLRLRRSPLQPFCAWAIWGD